jgi:FAD/FMN-containing dehydrogenase
MSITLSTSELRALRAEFDGRVFGPGDAVHDGARRDLHGAVERHPAAVVQPRDAHDVARVVTIIRDTGLPLAVRSGGHSLAGHSTCDGGIVLDLTSMRHVEVDVADRTAWAQTGLTAGELTEATLADGLTVGLGDTASVGIGGLVLGGGIGFRSREHGLTIDSLLAAEVVTADGDVLHVDEEHHPDLFWGLRGGGGNLGIATRFRFRLHEIATVMAGMLILPASPATVAAFVAALDAAPGDLAATVDVLIAPPLPFLPEAVHGQPVIAASVCCAGRLDEGEQAIAPLRAVAPPLLDTIAPVPYSEAFVPEEEERLLAHYHPAYIDMVDEAAAATILEQVEASTALMSTVQLRVLGGAIDRVAADATAYAHRGRRILATPMVFFADPEETDGHRHWARDLGATLEGSGAYVNFLGEDGASRIREAYPGATWDRLVEVKRRWDPTNIFRLNHNIPTDA